MNTEHLIFSNLLENEEYGRKVLAFLKPEYFMDLHSATVFSLIAEHVDEYNTFPTKEELYIGLNAVRGIDEHTLKRANETIGALQRDPKTNPEWLLDQTEAFCKKRALRKTIEQSLVIYDGKDPKYTEDNLPKLFQDAISVSFDTTIGTDFIDDMGELYDSLHTKEQLIPFDLDYFNRVTGGGLSRKTLNVILAGTNVGKSLFMCHHAASCLSMGYNVLYVSMEMSESKIQRRIAANLLDIPLDELKTISKQSFDAKVAKLKGRLKLGKQLKIKEYPTSQAGSAHFRHLFNELKLKKNFVPDIIFIDYLNICISTRVRLGSNVNSYTYIKNIAEELRGLAVEFNVPIVTATQTNRTGFGESDLGLEHTSESFGLPATADFMVGLSTSEELEQLGQLMVKQLKARDHDKKTIKRFVIGVDYSKMRLYDVEQSAQSLQGDDSPLMDKTDFGRKDGERMATPKPFDKSKFQGFK